MSKKESLLIKENTGLDIVLEWNPIREALVKNQVDSSETVRVRDGENDEWRDLITFPYGEDGNLIDFCKDSKTCCMISSLWRETTALQKVDLATGETLEVVSNKNKSDYGGVILDDNTKYLKVVAFYYARTERVFFNTELEKDYEMLKSLWYDNTEVGVVSKTENEKTWVVAYSRSDGPTEYVIYDQHKKETSKQRFHLKVLQLPIGSNKLCEYYESSILQYKF